MSDCLPSGVEPKGKRTPIIIRPQNVPEHVVWWAITWTYPLWLIGGLYIVGSILGWVLLALLVVKILAQDDSTPQKDRITISWVTWLWMIGMVIMEVSLLAGHLDYNLGLDMIIKSSIGWAKGWAALALYLLAANLRIRPEIIVRAVCIIGFQTLLITPVLLLAPYLHLPETLYLSPLQAVGGPGQEFFDVRLFEIDPSNDQFRWRLFTPWAPALGFVGNVYFMLSLQEKNKKWQLFGLAGALLMCLICQSRLAQLCLFLIPLLTMVLTSLRRPLVLIGLGLIFYVSGLFASFVIDFVDNFWESFKSARADSTRVRMALNRIAIFRWQTEAPIWGHGIVERGSHIVEWMPIGSHHTWAGLLFVKGIVGFLALAVPMLALIMTLMWRASNPRYQLGATGFSIAVILLLYTFGENLEILVYLYWPGMIFIGLALQDQPLPMLQAPTALTPGSRS
jgi:hypothetical protein